jgi:hypothetical protein
VTLRDYLPRQMAGRAATMIQVPAVDVRLLLDGVDVLKMDVEGQEHALLAAGWEQLRTHRPTIFVEVLPGTPQLRAILARLCTELGYRCYVPHQERLVSVPARRLATICLQREHGTNDLVLYAQPDVARGWLPITRGGIRGEGPARVGREALVHPETSGLTATCRRCKSVGKLSEGDSTPGRSSGEVFGEGAPRRR